MFSLKSLVPHFLGSERLRETESEGGRRGQLSPVFSSLMARSGSGSREFKPSGSYRFEVNREDSVRRLQRPQRWRELKFCKHRGKLEQRLNGNVTYRKQGRGQQNGSVSKNVHHTSLSSSPRSHGARTKLTLEAVLWPLHMHGGIHASAYILTAYPIIISK